MSQINDATSTRILKTVDLNAVDLKAVESNTAVLNTAVLNATEIAKLIPHHGTMCLLASVNTFDDNRIHCTAVSHRLPNNPLREHNALHAICGVEYAAQAMAIHGALLDAVSGNADAKPRGGRLAGVRSVHVFVKNLDTIAEPLDVYATLLMRDASSMIYEFVLSTPEQLLLQGKATVILMPSD